MYAVFFVALAWLQCCSSSAVDAPPVLLVSLDGLGWKFTGGEQSKTPNLDNIASNGVHAEYMLTVTPTKTWPTHQTYVTGLYPESHGIVSNNFWDPLFKEKFILQYDCSNFDPKFYDAAEPIWLTLQKQGNRSGVHFWPGFYSYKEKPSLFEKPTCFVNCTALNMDSKNLWQHRNKTRSGWPPYIHCFANQSLPYKNRIDKILNWLQEKNPPKFLALYINEPDSSGHSFGINTGEYVEAIKRVDKDVVGYLIQRLQNANLLHKINVIFVSDHSMIETSSSRAIYLSDLVDTNTFTMSEQGVIGHLWPNDPNLEDQIYANLTRVQNPHMKVYKKRDIPSNLHWKNNRRVPPIYIETEVGWVVQPNRPAVSSNWTNAEHGWQASKELGAIFYARGPSFKRGYKTKQALQAIDVYPLLCHLLGIKPLPNNGSLENMKEILHSNPSSASVRCAFSTIITCVVPFVMLLAIV